MKLRRKKPRREARIFDGAIRGRGVAVVFILMSSVAFSDDIIGSGVGWADT
jgi:hypothetical protein